MFILIFRFFNLCLMVDFVIWSVFATCVGSSSIILPYVAILVFWMEESVEDTVQYIRFAVVGSWGHCHGVIQQEVFVV